MAFLAAAAPMLSTIGTLVSAGGTLAGGLYAAGVASNNAKIAEQNKVYAEQAGQVEAMETGIKGAQKEARLKTGIAANGIDVNTGSSVDVMASQKAADVLDVSRVLHEADLSAYGYQTQKQNYQAQAGQDVLGAITGTASTLAEGASSLNFDWTRPKNSWTAARESVYG